METLRSSGRLIFPESTRPPAQLYARIDPNAVSTASLKRSVTVGGLCRTTMSFDGMLSCKIACASADGAAASAIRTTANAMVLLFKPLLRSRPRGRGQRKLRSAREGRCAFSVAAREAGGARSRDDAHGNGDKGREGRLGRGGQRLPDGVRRRVQRPGEQKSGQRERELECEPEEERRLERRRPRDVAEWMKRSRNSWTTNAKGGSSRISGEVAGRRRSPLKPVTPLENERSAKRRRGRPRARTARSRSSRDRCGRARLPGHEGLRSQAGSRARDLRAVHPA